MRIAICVLMTLAAVVLAFICSATGAWVSFAIADIAAGLWCFNLINEIINLSKEN